MPPADPLPSDPLLLDAAGVAKALSISPSHLHQLRRGGQFPLMPVKLGKSVRWKSCELARWIGLGCPAANAWRFQNQNQRKSA